MGSRETGSHSQQQELPRGPEAGARPVLTEPARGLPAARPAVPDSRSPPHVRPEHPRTDNARQLVSLPSTINQITTRQSSPRGHRSGKIHSFLQWLCAPGRPAISGSMKHFIHQDPKPICLFLQLHPSLSLPAVGEVGRGRKETRTFLPSPLSAGPQPSTALLSAGSKVTGLDRSDQGFPTSFSY